MNKDLSKRIEVVLFLSGEPLSLDRLSKFFGKDKEEITSAIRQLDLDLSQTPLQLVFKDDKAELVTKKEFSQDAQNFAKENISSELSKASAETLSIIAYKGPITRSEIDYVRGVNSSFTLRNLLMRGLAEREQNPKDARTFVYSPSFELLKMLGVSSVGDLPEYAKVRERIEEFVKENNSSNIEKND